MNVMANRPPFDPKPTTLKGQHVHLEPLSEAHAAGLYEIGRDEVIWRYISRPPFTDLDDATSWVKAACDEASGGQRIPFAIVEASTDSVLGSTSYLAIQRANRTLEIGWTWLAVSAQRTPVNTECKFLLLRHAFDTLGAMRVQFMTDLRNERSQRAIERIGAVREGVLRHHRLVRGDTIRDTVVYSITDVEWTSYVKTQLAQRLTTTKQKQHPA